MKLAEKTILVTGGAGFIGSHVATMLAEGNTVIAYDNFASNTRTPQQLKEHGVDVITGDILNSEDIERAMSEVDVVFHMAAAHLRASLSDPISNHTVNATGALTVLYAAQNAHVDRVIAISSSESFGTATSDKMSEDHPHEPTTVYGMSKYMEELYAYLFHTQFHLDTMIVRPFNTYGPFSHYEKEFGEVIPRFVLRALAGKQPVIFGDGMQTRDFTYVTDTASGIIAAAECDEFLGSSVNVARGEEVPIKRIAELVCEYVGIPFMPEHKPQRPHDVERHIADITKLTTHTSFRPQISIEDGIKQYIDWAKTYYTQPEKLLSDMPETNW